jgi:bifunctional non-homologous end joining protein LigD
MDPEVKRLAIKVENHPLPYVHFEAVIPAGHYGAGPMICWDRGQFRPLLDPTQAIADGELKFELFGYKLRGAFTLVHTGKVRRGRGGGRGANDWLLIKKLDDPARAFLAGGAPLPEASILSGLTVGELEAGAPARKAALAELADAPRRAVDLATLAPMLCHVGDAPFSSDEWAFELKYDGFRLLAAGGAGQARLRYRSGRDPTERYPELTSALRALPTPGLILDGELIAEDAAGHPDFHRLQARAQLTRANDVERAALAAPVSYLVFDLLAADGRDLRGLPLAARKALLARLVPRLGPVRYADHVVGHGEALLAAVVSRGLEGVVAKRLASPYRATRSRDWLKLKTDPEADFAICGYTAPKGSRAGLGALHLCVRDGDAWVWAGKVGTGLDDRELVALRAELDARPAWRPTFPRPEGSRDARWVEPDLAVQIRYREWPVGHAVRFPVFVRLRRDKPATACTPPARHTGQTGAHGDGEPPDEIADASALVSDAPAARELRLSNVSKIYWPAHGGHPAIRKGELIAYYRAIAPCLLPYLRDRPVVLTRYPDGIDGEMFYQKDMPDWTPPWLRTTALWSDHSQREIHYVLLDDADGLAYVANLGSIPIHAWASRIHDLQRPDWTILDLDPKNAPRAHVVPLALAIRALCASIGLPSYVKTSGQSGLHVLMPLGGQCTYEQARTLAYLLGMIIERRHPDMATTHRNPTARGGRVYLDWGQNAHGQLLVAPYSVRPVPEAAVSMPVTWDEVVPELDARAFTMRDALDRVSRWPGDPCLPVLTERPDLAAVMAALDRVAREPV